MFHEMIKRLVLVKKELKTTADFGSASLFYLCKPSKYELQKILKITCLNWQCLYKFAQI